MLGYLIAFAAAAFVLAMVPGPAMALVLRQTIRGGRRRAFVTILGIEGGILFWAVAAGLGLTGLVLASRTAYDALRAAGVVVLVTLGVQSLLRARREGVHGTVAEQSQDDGTASGRAFHMGLATNLANPKLAVFAVSFLPQFVPPHAAVLPTLLLLAVVQVLCDTIWWVVLALAVDRAKRVLGRPRIRRRLEQLSGVALIGFGLGLAAERR